MSGLDGGHPGSFLVGCGCEEVGWLPFGADAKSGLVVADGSPFLTESNGGDGGDVDSGEGLLLIVDDLAGEFEFGEDFGENLDFEIGVIREREGVTGRERGVGDGEVAVAEFEAEFAILIGGGRVGEHGFHLKWAAGGVGDFNIRDLVETKTILHDLDTLVGEEFFGGFVEKLTEDTGSGLQTEIFLHFGLSGHHDEAGVGWGGETRGFGGEQVRVVKGDVEFIFAVGVGPGGMLEGIGGVVGT